MSKELGLAVKVAHNPNSSDDEYIAGEITVPPSATDENLSFTVDCSSYPSKAYGLIYQITKNTNNKYTVSHLLGNANKDLYTKENPDYELKNGQLESTGESVMSKRPGNGRTKIQKQQ